VSASAPDDEAAARVRASFARQTIMTTIGAEILAVRRGEVEIVLSYSGFSSSTASSTPAQLPPSPTAPAAMPA
jgi:hypothetical protein